MKSVVLGVMFFSTLVFAHGEMTRITGEGINLAYRDHALAGSVKDQIVMGFWGQGVSQLNVRASNGELLQLNPKLLNGKQGVEVEISGSKKLVYKLNRIDSQKDEIHILINDKEAVFQIHSEFEKNGSHFKNPTVEGEIDGKSFRFQIEDGEACYGCLSNIVYMILVPYLINDLLAE
jgi:hypothetical protein